MIAQLRRSWRRWRHRGVAHHCALCDSNLRSFLPHGTPPRPQSVCPVCQCRERHRLAWHYMEGHVLAKSRRLRVLHLAPEDAIRGRFRARPGVDYVCGDLRPGASVRFDVHALPFADASFDFIYCSHVLNMVWDDVAALREIGRVLDRRGLALVQAPLSAELRTLELGAEWTDAQRLAAFSDPAIRRRYGQDVVERLRASGLEVERLQYARSIEHAEFERQGLIDEDLLLCRHKEAA
jgi:SAM-dependent methyltransferase